MDEFSINEKNRIMAALESRGATKPCPRCGNDVFAILDGYINHFVQTRPGDVIIGGPSVPTAVVVCTKCGWLAEHALGGLQLLPEKKETASKEKP
jgi:ribosomal protein S27AE